MPGKNFVPEIWAKIFSANQIAGFFESTTSHSMKYLDILHVDTN